MSEVSKSSVVRVPKYSRQKEKSRPDRACVWVNGKKILLGTYGSPESRARYAELIGNPLPEKPEAAGTITVAVLMAKYLEFAQEYYPPTKMRKTSEFDAVRCALRHVRKVAGPLPATEFGPKKLKAVRQSFIEAGQCRGTINQNVGRIVRMFRWAASEEFIPGSVWQNLAAVSGLRRGKTKAPDKPAVLPVDDATIATTLERVPDVIGDMVRLQRTTGMRPAELCMLRPCDVERTGSVWLYRPESHKTQHHGKDRVVLIGPKGQGILLKYLARAADDYCFRPCDSEAKRRAAQHDARQTPMNQGNRPGTNQVSSPQRPPGEKYTTNSYRRAIHRGCDKAGIPRWSPNRLRHSAATEIRRDFGLEAAQIVLGHSSADVTQVYAERDLQLGLRIAEKIG